MGPGDDLFMALAQAKAQPSKALRATEAAGEAGKDIIGGYLQGRALRASQQEAALKPFEIWSKIADSAGPDVANNIFKQRGIPIPNMTSGQPTSSEPSALINQGKRGTQLLTNMKSAQDLQNNAPYSAAEVKGMLASNPQAADALIQAYPNGQIPSRVVQNAISGLSANRLSGLIGTRQFQLLPSQSGPNTAAGAAYQVKVAARQGKSLIAKATTPQGLSLASADLARAVQRAAPMAETIGASNYASSLPTLFGQLSQRLTADPNSPDVPKLRKNLYDQFNELEKASTPWIANHLQNMEDSGTSSTFGNNWNSVKQRELGMNIPDIPFDMNTGGAKTYQKTAADAKGNLIGTNDNWVTYEPVQGGQ